MADADPIHSLHRMSPTAGVASQGMLPLIIWPSSRRSSAWPGFLPPLKRWGDRVVGVILSLLAMLQIRCSAGTESGVALTPGVAAVNRKRRAVGYSVYKDHREQAADDVEINAILKQLGDDFRAVGPGPVTEKNISKLTDAYGLFTQSFRDLIPPATFER